MINGTNDVHDSDFAAQAIVETKKSSRYMKALCNHFDRKATASYDNDVGSITLSSGKCALIALPERLQINVVAKNEDNLEQIKRVIATHLVRFGQKDELSVHWS